ncbi:hypothetical protein ACFFRR_011428 [Megaselia abdita]
MEIKQEEFKTFCLEADKEMKSEGLIDSGFCNYSSEELNSEENPIIVEVKQESEVNYDLIEYCSTSEETEPKTSFDGTLESESTPTKNRKKYVKKVKPTFEINDELDSLKPPLPKIVLPLILNSIDELQVTTFTIQDLAKYLKTKYKIGTNERVHSKIYKRLQWHREKFFKQISDRKWEVIKSSDIPRIEKDFSYRTVHKIGLPRVLKCIEELKLTIFTVGDIVKYLQSNGEVGTYKELHDKVYKTLKKYQERHFRKNESKKWQLISSGTRYLKDKEESGCRPNFVIIEDLPSSVHSTPSEEEPFHGFSPMSQEDSEPKPPIPKIKLEEILKIVEDWPTFTTDRIVEYYESKYEVGNKGSKSSVHRSIYHILKCNRGTHFNKISYRDWRLIKSSNEQLPKFEVKVIGLPKIIKCLQELKLTTFTVHDIVNYFESNKTFGSKTELYIKIYKTLTKHRDIRFKQLAGRKWKLIEQQDCPDEQQEDIHKTVEEHQGPKPPLPKIKLPEILKSIEGLQSFTTEDIVTYFEQNYEIGCKDSKNMYRSIYNTLRWHRGKVFNKMSFRDWELIETTNSPKELPDDPKEWIQMDTTSTLPTPIKMESDQGECSNNSSTNSFVPMLPTLIKKEEHLGESSSSNSSTVLQTPVKIEKDEQECIPQITIKSENEGSSHPFVSIFPIKIKDEKDEYIQEEFHS